MYKKCPDLLKKSLRCWLKAAIEGAPHDDPTRISTKRLGHVVYGMRSLRLRELVSLTQAEDFADAIYKLTGRRLGHLSQGTPRNKSEQEGVKAHWPLGTLPKSSPHAGKAYNQRAPEKGKGGKKGKKKYDPRNDNYPRSNAERCHDRGKGTRRASTHNPEPLPTEKSSGAPQVSLPPPSPSRIVQYLLPPLKAGLIRQDHLLRQAPVFQERANKQFGALSKIWDISPPSPTKTPLFPGEQTKEVPPDWSTRQMAEAQTNPAPCPAGTAAEKQGHQAESWDPQLNNRHRHQ